LESANPTTATTCRHPIRRASAHASPWNPALRAASLDAAAIGYINLHGTGTTSNDTAECAAVTQLFGTALPCSSTKGATGHTLGAAGALEAVICALALQDQLLPGGSIRARSIQRCT